MDAERVEDGGGAEARAEALLAAGRPAEAVRLLAAAVAGAPEDPDLRSALARALHVAGDLPAALREAERASALAPEWFFPLCQQASILLARGRPWQARKRAEAARRLAPEQALSHEWCGRAALQCGSHRQVRECLERWRELAPSDPDLFILESRLEFTRRQWAAAEAAAREALRLDPGDAEALHLLGVILTHSDRPREAAEVLVQAGRARATAEVAADTARAVDAHDGPVYLAMILGILVPWLLAFAFLSPRMPLWAPLLVLLANVGAVRLALIWRARRRAHLPQASVAVAQAHTRRQLRDAWRFIQGMALTGLVLVGIGRAFAVLTHRPGAPPPGTFDVVLYGLLLCATIVLGALRLRGPRDRS